MLDKSAAEKLPLIIIDSPRLTVSTMSLVPYIDTDKDIEKYKERLKEKMQNENINLNSIIL